MELYQRQRERATERKISSERGTRQRERERNTSHGSIFRPFAAFSRLGGISAGWNGSRTRHDLRRLTDSGTGQERQPRTPRVSTVLSTARSTEIPRCAYVQEICRETVGAKSVVAQICRKSAVAKRKDRLGKDGLKKASTRLYTYYLHTYILS